MIENIIEKIASYYLRVSTEDQKKEGHSLEVQFLDCDKRREKEGLQKGRVYQDVESGYIDTREQYQQMLRDAKAGKFHVLIVWRLDRLTRNTLEGLRVVNQLVEVYGIQIISVKEDLDFKTARGKRNLREDLSDAEYERDRIKERVRPGMIRGTQKGNWQGARHAPLGYRYDKGSKKLIENDEEVKTVRAIFQLRANGASTYSILLELSNRGIRNRAGRCFTTRQMEVSLKRTLYADGHIVWSEARSEKPVVIPIIDKETWEKAQAVNRERTHEPRKSIGRITSDYILQGVLKCRYCGANMVGQRLTKNHRTRETSQWYVCGTLAQRTRKACRGQYVKGETAHFLGLEILKKVMQDPRVIDWTRQQLKIALEQGHPHLSRRVRELRVSLQKLKKQQTQCLQAHYAGAVTLEQLKSENLRLDGERIEAERELSQTEAKLHGAAAFQGKIDKVFDLLKEFDQMWEVMSPVLKRAVYRGAFNYLKIEGKRKSCKVEGFSLKEPFRSWYNNQIWNGSILITPEGAVLLKTKQEQDLCENFTFAHLDVR